MTNGDKMRQQSDLALAAVITCVNCPPRSKQDCKHEKQEPCEECVMCWHRYVFSGDLIDCPTIIEAEGEE